MGHLLRGRSPWSASLAGTNITEQHLSTPATGYSMRLPGIQAAAVQAVIAARSTMSMTLALTSAARSSFRSFITGLPNIIHSSILTGRHFTRPAARTCPLSRFLRSWSEAGIPREYDSFVMHQPNCSSLSWRNAAAHEYSVVQQLHAFQTRTRFPGLEQQRFHD